MNTIASVPIENPRGQCIIMLLAALHELGGNHSKQESISFIQQRHWFNVQQEDLLPYSSQTTKEPRWHTLIAWSRKDAVEAELMFKHGQDEWELTRRGIEDFLALKAKYQSGPLFAGHCFMWSIAFKQWMSPSFTPSARDWPRPKDIYKDVQESTSRNIGLRVLEAILGDKPTIK